MIAHFASPDVWLFSFVWRTPPWMISHLTFGGMSVDLCNSDHFAWSYTHEYQLQEVIVRSAEKFALKIIRSALGFYRMITIDIYLLYSESAVELLLLVEKARESCNSEPEYVNIRHYWAAVRTDSKDAGDLIVSVIINHLLFEW